MLELALFLAPLLGGDPPPDVIELKRGRKVTGVILFVGPEEVRIADGSRRKTIRRSEIVSMTGPRLAWPEYVERLRRHFAAPEATADQAVELAEWCAAQGLLRDTEFLYLRALSLDPDQEKARAALGHVRRGGDWVVKVGNGGRTTWRRLLERRLDMDEPWEFSTSHFDVEAAGPLPEILAAAAELEEVYEAFFRLFQAGVGFHEVLAPMEVRIYPDFDAFPALSNNLDSYFHRQTRILHTYLRDGRASRLQHEAVHELMYFTARELDRKEPSLPGWLEEGLADYLDSSLDGPPGSLRLEPGRINEELFRDHVTARKRDDLTRVLNYQTTDFGSSTGQRRRYAESYTLVQFLLHGAGGARAEGLHAFLASAYRGQGSMSHFKKVFEVRDLDDLDAEWQAWVEANAPKD